MPTIRRCCIVGCQSNSRQNPQLQFFQFPRPENPFHRLWKQACVASLARILPFKKPVVCALHFHASCIGGRRLTGNAVPSLHLEVPSNLKAVEQKAMLDEIERSRKCAYINAVVYEWLVRANLNSQLRGSITHGMIKEKAELAKNIIGSTNFVADNRWLNRFRETHLQGFAQKLAANELKPMGSSLWIPEIVQDLHSLFPPTSPDRLVNLENVPERYIDYMQQYGEYEEEEDTEQDQTYADIKPTYPDIKPTPYMLQHQQQWQQQQQQQHMQQQQQHQSSAYAHNPYDPYAQSAYNYNDYYQHNAAASQQLYAPPSMQPMTSAMPAAPPQIVTHQQPVQSAMSGAQNISPPPVMPAQPAAHKAYFSPRSAHSNTNSPANSRPTSRGPTPTSKRSSPDTFSQPPAAKLQKLEEEQNSEVNGQSNGNVNGNSTLPIEDLTDDIDENTRHSTQSIRSNNSNSQSRRINHVQSNGSGSIAVIKENGFSENSNAIDDEKSKNNNDSKTPNGNATLTSSNSTKLAANGQNNGEFITVPKYITSYEEALRLLKPLEDFALIKENFRAIGLVDTLGRVFRTGDEEVIAPVRSKQN